ncbi:meiosis expressed gene 1 protein homolog isoform X1 [Balaenoptera ricei]|uniref:meiosis expressed gene 1 protein homolog isoform X1 n=1 Tax=Balaenoptera ricei TaxID=2746895 RepID=UPI0028BD373E|nr:meiosis expressed gene 1 protein homolog isoform X1 [Balaenoptera ricei]
MERTFASWKVRNLKSPASGSFPPESPPGGASPWGQLLGPVPAAAAREDMFQCCLAPLQEQPSANAQRRPLTRETEEAPPRQSCFPELPAPRSSVSFSQFKTVPLGLPWWRSG